MFRFVMIRCSFGKMVSDCRYLEPCIDATVMRTHPSIKLAEQVCTIPALRAGTGRYTAVRRWGRRVDHVTIAVDVVLMRLQRDFVGLHGLLQAQL